ncbi:MAG: hypothetical protein OXU64_03765 [Gemmatimonadota bacterium]|nr:hypothetical protein [Gemmatimonadota bacterium]
MTSGEAKFCLWLDGVEAVVEKYGGRLPMWPGGKDALYRFGRITWEEAHGDRPRPRGLLLAPPRRSVPGPRAMTAAGF